MFELLDVYLCDGPISGLSGRSLLYYWPHALSFLLIILKNFTPPRRSQALFAFRTKGFACGAIKADSLP